MLESQDWPWELSLSGFRRGAVPTERKSGIDRTVDLLEALLRLRSPTRLGDLAKRMGAPRSTVYAIANRLLEAEILEAVGEDGYVYFGKALHLLRPGLRGGQSVLSLTPRQA